MTKIVGELEIDQDLQLERRYWKVQRVAWLIIALVLIAALAGLFGSGPLSKRTAGDLESGLQIQYDRFTRYQGSTDLQLFVSPVTSRQNIRLRINQAFVKAMEIKHIDPEPETVEAAWDKLVYIFPVTPGFDQKPTRIIFHVEPKEYGAVIAEFGVEGRRSIFFEQFVYP